MAPRSAIRRLLDRPPAAPVRGVVQPGSGLKRIVVACEPALFDRISLLAAASGVSFAEAVRQLLQRGIDNSVDSTRYDRAMEQLRTGATPPIAGED